MKSIIKIIPFVIVGIAFSQEKDSTSNENYSIPNDTIKPLKTVLITPKQQSPERMPEKKDFVLYTGKKMKS